MSLQQPTFPCAGYSLAGDVPGIIETQGIHYQRLQLRLGETSSAASGGLRDLPGKMIPCATKWRIGLQED